MEIEVGVKRCVEQEGGLVGTGLQDNCERNFFARQNLLTATARIRFDARTLGINSQPGNVP